MKAGRPSHSASMPKQGTVKRAARGDLFISVKRLFQSVPEKQFVAENLFAAVEDGLTRNEAHVVVGLRLTKSVERLAGSQHVCDIGKWREELERTWQRYVGRGR
jgi:hypothetical protein